MIPFLKSIASAYAERYDDLSEFCFLFPNKRSGRFFLKYLRDISPNRVMMAPNVLTINDFVSEISGKVLAPTIHQLFLLFKIYESYVESSVIEPLGGDVIEQLKNEDTGEETENVSSLLRDEENLMDGIDIEEEGLDFDAFKIWGETALSDFSIVDQYMVDAEELFKNVKDHGEITTNYLTDQQREIIEEYFGYKEFGDYSGFWKNFNDEGELSSLRKKFLHLWRIMYPLYKKLKEELGNHGLSTNGGMYREAYETLNEKGRDILPYKKVVVVGFNALSLSEFSIFSELQAFDGYVGYDEFADFYWDATGPVLNNSEINSNSASRFVNLNKKHFPSPKWAINWVEKSDNEEMPEINIIAAPSNSAQAKIVGKLLETLIPGHKEGNKHDNQDFSNEKINEAKVAVVLPDEGLLLPILYSIPNELENVNLTMGYSFKFTSVSSFVYMIRRLALTMHERKGDKEFYHRDLRLFLTHPFAYILFGSRQIEKFLESLKETHQIYLSISTLKTFFPFAEKVFNIPGKNNDAMGAVFYLNSLLKMISDRIMENSGGRNDKVDVAHINLYRDYLVIFADAVKEYGIKMSPTTVFRMVDRLISKEKISFEGEPLVGLQVMGTLETRSLDFDEIFVLSMNERVMPRRARTRSFIPDILRRGYGMPPSNYAEEIFAYYFYRMISRAKKVTLLYDARNNGGTKAGESRYLQQLRYLYAPDKIEKQNWKFSLKGKSPESHDIKKTVDIKKLLERYLSEDDNKKNLSASTLNKYRACQVKFFYETLLGINTDPEPSETIDAINIGNVLHSTMLDLYIPNAQEQNILLEGNLILEKESLKKLLDNEEYINSLIIKHINHYHRGMEYDHKNIQAPLSPDNDIVARQILGHVKEIINHDIKISPIRMYGGELKENFRIKIDDTRNVNFTFAIDRLDAIKVGDKWQLRIIDYKTGFSKVKINSESDLFGGNGGEHLFQLFIYAWLLGKLDKLPKEMTENVRMEIYSPIKFSSLKKQAKKGVEEVILPKIGDLEIKGFAEQLGEEPLNKVFDNGIKEMVKEIFDAGEFVQVVDENNCKYCDLKILCNR